jgi:hypothetical protein
MARGGAPVARQEYRARRLSIPLTNSLGSRVEIACDGPRSLATDHPKQARLADQLIDQLFRAGRLLYVYAFDCLSVLQQLPRQACATQNRTGAGGALLAQISKRTARTSETSNKITPFARSNL